MKVVVWLAAMALLVGGCSGDGSSDSTVSPTTVATTLTPAPTATTITPVTTMAAPSTTAPIATTTTTTTTAIPPIVVAGGDIPVASLIDTVEAEYQAWWDYYLPEKPGGIVGPVEIACDHESDVGFGAVLLCEATPLEERESWPGPFPIVMLVTGDDGSVKYRRDLGTEAAYRTTGPGKFCRDIISQNWESSSYFDAVAYWFLEGRPDRMDADRDGIPCGTVYSLWDIWEFWHGSPHEAETDIHFGGFSDVVDRGSYYELTANYSFFLGGMEANLAAEAAGDIAPGEGVPNDYYIIDDGLGPQTLRLPNDLEVTVLGYRDGIEEIAIEPSLWMELRAEADRCDAAGWPDDCTGLGGDDWSWFGSGYLPYWIHVDGDTVVRIEEQYLP